ncbi:hypothetical protein FKW77_008104 [Venturia effusa]|uniref:Uncharacterized protein n=1 Tax=Venturia effusa TaxID=50376 RepID=A0A517LBB7_9PEZI|nr:hypothetical protein FKW77_008104 [Venturia effusa]
MNIMLQLEDPDRRPPQLNTTICGTHCGCVSEGRGSDDGSDSGRDVQVELDYQRGDEGVEDDSIMVPMPMKPLGPVQHLFTEYADYDVDEHGGFRLGRGKYVWEYPFKEVCDSYERVQSPQSLAMHPHNAEAASLYSSGPQTRRSDSPGPIFTAICLNTIGTWTAPSGYRVFTPLALTTQDILLPDECSTVAEQAMYPDSIESGELED